jgi:ABC-2 type transport system ATP-binding protein
MSPEQGGRLGIENHEALSPGSHPDRRLHAEGKSMQTAIIVEDLRKRYDEVRAVDGASFEVRQGEIFGMVGPNGAGKTTTIECIEGLRRPDGGLIRVLGLDPASETRELRLRTGVQLQESSLPDRLRVIEALGLFASFYPSAESPDELLALLGLEEKRRARCGNLSGGQKQRLFIALALIGRPELVFLDELTTGLDPQSRHHMWDLVRTIREQGHTVFLTTHYMEEAERLCDRVAIMDHGRIVALDSPTALIRTLGVDRRLSFRVEHDCPDLKLHELPMVQRVEHLGDRLVVYGQGDRLVSSVVNAAEAAGVGVLDLRTEEPNLEDVFLRLTGRDMRE